MAILEATNGLSPEAWRRLCESAKLYVIAEAYFKVVGVFEPAAHHVLYRLSRNGDPP